MTCSSIYKNDHIKIFIKLIKGLQKAGDHHNLSCVSMKSHNFELPFIQLVRKVVIVLESVAVQKNHKLVLNNRKAGLVTGVLDVLSFNLNEILLETEQGMLMVKGTDLHVNRVNLEKGEIDLSGNIDSISYSDIHSTAKQGESFFGKLFR